MDSGQVTVNEGDQAVNTGKFADPELRGLEYADGMRGSIFFGIPRDANALNLAGSSYAHSLTRVFTGDKVDTILQRSEDPAHNTIITGTTQNWNSFPTFNGIADDFVTALSGTFFPAATGSYRTSHSSSHL